MGIQQGGSSNSNTNVKIKLCGLEPWVPLPQDCSKPRAEAEASPPHNEVFMLVVAKIDYCYTVYTYTFVQEHSRTIVACKASKYSIAESCARTMALDFFQAAAALAQVSQWQAMASPQALQMYGNYVRPVPIKIGKGLKYSLVQPCVKHWTKVLWSQLMVP